jgi:ferredoxin--NADP+ reductase
MFNEETVLKVHHWTDRLFSFTTTRSPTFRFESGHFTMLGLRINGGKPLLRAYSIASANYEDHLEFFSIKVPDGPLTSRLQHLREGDKVLISRKPTGTLVIDALKPGKRLWLLGTGTGLAPYLSLIRDPEVYERFERVILVHGVRHVADLAYQEYITNELPKHELVGEQVQKQLSYYPTVTREPYVHQGRITRLLETGQLHADLGLPPLDPAEDRVMICGSIDVLRDLRAFFVERGFEEGATNRPGDFVVEKAFAQ